MSCGTLLVCRAGWRRLVCGAVFLVWPASASGAKPSAQICVLRQGWVAPIAPEDVAGALAIRETGRRVSVCDTPSKATGGCDLVMSTSPGGVMTVLVSCGQGPTVMDEVPAGLASDVARRVAVEASLLLVTAQASAERSEAAGNAADKPVENASDKAAPAAPSVTATQAPSPTSARAKRYVTLRLAAGESYAQELSDGTYAIIIDARWFALQHGFLTLGLKLAGPFEQRFGAEVDTASDRALWLGGGYRLDFTRLFLDLSVAGAYTVPVLESQNNTERDFQDSGLSRVGVRGGVLAGWSFHSNAAAVLELATIVSLQERDISTDGRESMDLGTMVLDLTLGLEVQF